MKEHRIDPHSFLDFVHDIDRSSLAPDARLGGAIEALPGRKFVFTNGSVRHAEETLRQLGVDGHFHGIFDIVAGDFNPKPARCTYERFLDKYGIAPVSAAMFEDIPRNLEVPAELGMRTVLVVPGEAGDHKEDWERYVEHGPGALGIPGCKTRGWRGSGCPIWPMPGCCGIGIGCGMGIGCGAG
jgi:putative hydrolase of the HAD superfamily